MSAGAGGGGAAAQRGQYDGLTRLLYDGFEAFKTDVEDGSVEAVAARLVAIRRALAGGDAAPAMAAAAAAHDAGRRRPRGVDRSVRAPRPAGGAGGEGADSSDDDGGGVGGGDDAMDMEGPRPPRPPPPPPQVDEDGFETVAPRRRRR